MDQTTSSSGPGGTGFRLSSLLSLNLLLIFLPVALIARAAGWNPIVVFITSSLAIIPLASLIGESTEALAAKLGPTAGGLINATLGNAAELIITIFALREGLIELVKASLIGSVIGNLLLVAGFSLIVGGVRNGVQRFDRRTAGVSTTLVIMAFLALAIPSAFDAPIMAGDGNPVLREQLFSEGIAIVMIVLYGLYIAFTLRAPERSPDARLAEAAHETHADQMSAGRALGMLALATVGIVFMSEALVGAVEPVGVSLGLSEFFIGIIIVPLVGNVAEHLVAVQVAYKNRMELSMGISLGSSLQIALFVAPVLVFISLLFENKLLLVFNSYELLALATASIVTVLVAQDGETNWLEGVMLLALYVILGLAFYVLPATAVALPHAP